MTASATETSTTQLTVPLSMEPTLTALDEWFQDSLHLGLEQWPHEPQPHVTIFRESGGYSVTLVEARLLRDHLDALLRMAGVA